MKNEQNNAMVTAGSGKQKTLLIIPKSFFGDTQFKRQFFIYNFPTWMGGRDGEIWVKNAKDFLYSFFSSLGDYSAECDIYPDRILISIGHHDGRGVCRIEQGDPELER